MNSPVLAVTTSERTLSIEGMTGEKCISTVSAALKGVPNVNVHAVKVGSAFINTDEAGRDAAIAAISKSGFASRETTATTNGANTSNHANKASNANTSDQPGNHASGQHRVADASCSANGNSTSGNAPKVMNAPAVAPTSDDKSSPKSAGTNR